MSGGEPVRSDSPLPAYGGVAPVQGSTSGTDGRAALTPSFSLSVLEPILDSLQVGVSVRDHRLSLLYANRGWLGHGRPGPRAAQDIGLCASFRREELHLARAVFLEKRGLSRSIAVRCSDGSSRHYKLICSPLLGAREGPVAVTVSVEVSDAIDGHESREEPLQTLAHDVHNHIVAVVRNLELLLAGLAGSLSGAQKEILSATRDCGDLVLGLTSDVRDVIRADSGRLCLKRTRFSLVEALDESVRRCRGLGIDKGVRIERDAVCGDVTVNCDRRRIDRVLTNLLVNAVQFSPPRGAVSVACTRRNGNRAHVVTITDQGPGIPRDYQQLVFEKFFRIPGHGSHSGLGLGLYFCREAINAHGGEIWIESPPPDIRRGTRFLFSVPRSSDGRGR